MTPTAYAVMHEGELFNLQRDLDTAEWTQERTDGSVIEPLHRGAAELYAALEEAHKDLLILNLIACQEAKRSPEWSETARRVQAAIDRSREVLVKFGERS